MTLAARTPSRRLPFIIAGLAVLAALFAFAWLRQPVAPSGGPFNLAQVGDRGQLASFRSDDELRAFLRARQQVRRRASGMEPEEASDSVASPTPTPMAQAAPSPVARSTSESITNNQEVGVDEGGIVKNYRDMLVILRRGRVFTVSLAGGAMRPIDAIDASPPGVSGSGDWYDEMLISGDRVIVVGYSYARGGTEINRFRITPDGQLSFEDAYHLRSNDYYSSRNYASRLIGNQLIYYTPLYLNGGRGDPLDMLPGVRKWESGRERGAFRRIAEASDIYIAPGLRDDPDAAVNTLHSVVTCDLTARELDCDATGVLGPSSRTFYVSGKAVYLWTADQRRVGKRDEVQSHIYRLPFAEEERPSAIGARGAPVDQFSFREDADAGRLDVLVRAAGGGDGMWRPEVTDGAVALLQVPIARFNDGTREAEASLYRDLPAPRGNSYDFHNRFVGDYVLYGTGAGGGRQVAPGSHQVVAAPVRGRGAFELALAHPVDRIEALGGDGLVVGGVRGRRGDTDLGFTAIDLDRRGARVGDRHVQPASAEGESRSHAFFYRPDPGSDGGDGTLGLPIAKPVEARYRRFFGTAAAMLFLRRDDRRFSPAGELDAQPAGTVDDACRASCVDWYGNARPIFLGDRVFALLGYELVEGRMDGGRISEVDRTNFAPRSSGRTGSK